MRALIYMRDGLIYFPTVEHHEDGGTCRLVEIGPAWPLTDPGRLRQALDRHLATEVPIVDRIRWRDGRPLPPVPNDGAGRPIASWPRFFRGAWSWSVVATDTCRVWTSPPSVLRGKMPPPPQPITLRTGEVISDRLIVLMEQAALAESLAPYFVVPARSLARRMLRRVTHRLRRRFSRDILETVQAPPDTGLDDATWIGLPPGRRIDEQASLLEWLINSAPEDAPEIRNEIEQLYYRHGDKEGGDALSQALAEVHAATDAEQRRSILDRYEFYTRASRADD